MTDRLSQKFSNAALLVVDMQYEYCNVRGFGTIETERLSERIGGLVDAFRRAGARVCAISYDKADYYGYQPAVQDIVYVKGHDSAFREEALHKRLESEGIRDLYISGINLSHCVYKTAMDAVKLGYSVILLTDMTANGKCYVEGGCSSENRLHRMSTQGVGMLTASAVLGI